MSNHAPQAGPRPLVSRAALRELAAGLDQEALEAVTRTVRLWAKVKRNGGRVLVATGSGPNLHEGVTTQIAELVNLGLVDAVLTSSAVVGHEMAGTLEKVRRVDGNRLGLPEEMLPAGGKLEVSLLSADQLSRLGRDLDVDLTFYRNLLSAPGHEIIKVAGNLAYPTGLWLERMAALLTPRAQAAGLPLEAYAGLAADPATMIGACARAKAPCLVTVPQLVGGGQVGLAVGDSIPVSRRSALVAEALAGADLIIESGVALSQEIHDGPFELFTGHGLWARYQGMPTFSLKDKQVVRIDLDPRLKKAWQAERGEGKVSLAIDQGLSKNQATGIPFRMEMSGFARIPGALPIVADLGEVWPLLAARLAKSLGVKLGFLCYKQGRPAGEAVREHIVEKVAPLNPSLLLA